MTRALAALASTKRLPTPQRGAVFGLLALAAAGHLLAAMLSGDRFWADEAIGRAIQHTPGGRFLEPAADFVALHAIQYTLLSAAALLALRRRDHALAITVILVFGAIALNEPTKWLVSRERPGPLDMAIREPREGYGFPSGHTNAAILAYGYIIVVLWRYMPGKAGWTGIVLAAAAFGLVAWDRPYDGAHWPSDVVGAILIGVLMLALCEYLPRRLLHRRRAHASFDDPFLRAEFAAVRAANDR
jgi:membrane-associated phospholipid phosphatase